MKKIEDILNAIDEKYELYDISHNRLLPKSIVAFRHKNKLKHGIIFKVNQTKTTIFDSDLQKYLVLPDEQIIITDLNVSNPIIYDTLNKIYDNIFNKNDKTQVKTLYSVFMWEHKITKKLGLITIPIEIYNSNKLTKEAWETFLTNIKANPKYQTYNLYIQCFSSFINIFELNIVKNYPQLIKPYKDECGILCKDFNNNFIEYFFEVISTSNKKNKLDSQLHLFWTDDALTIIGNDKQFIHTSWHFTFKKWIPINSYKQSWNNTIKNYNLNKDYLM